MNDNCSDSETGIIQENYVNSMGDSSCYGVVCVCVCVRARVCVSISD